MILEHLRIDALATVVDGVSETLFLAMRALLDQVYQWAQSQGCESVGLYVAAENTEVEEFYRRCGFAFSYEYDDGAVIYTRQIGGSDDAR